MITYSTNTNTKTYVQDALMQTIPLYEQQVTAQPIAPAAEMRGEMRGDIAAAPFEALAQLGGQAADIAMEFKARRDQLKYKEDAANYDIARKALDTSISEAHVAGIEAKEDPETIYEQRIKPIISEFESNLYNNKGISAKARRDIQLQWKSDKASIGAAEKKKVLSRQLSNATEQLTRAYELAIIDGETEETILIDKRSYLFLNGMEIDYVEDIVNGGFRFKVPNSRECGCGMSFSPRE